jgi:hypothetical protein
MANPAGVGSPDAQSVQEHGKADSLLITELPALVRKLTDECLIEERASSDRALSCWDRAAQALDRYVTSLRGPLNEQIRRLQAMWRQRVADLESHRRAIAQSMTAIVCLDALQSVGSEPVRRNCGLLLDQARRASERCMRKRNRPRRACISRRRSRRQDHREHSTPKTDQPKDHGQETPAA